MMNMMVSSSFALELSGDVETEMIGMLKNRRRTNAEYGVF